MKIYYDSEYDQIVTLKQLEDAYNDMADELDDEDFAEYLSNCMTYNKGTLMEMVNIDMEEILMAYISMETNCSREQAIDIFYQIYDDVDELIKGVL